MYNTNRLCASAIAAALFLTAGPLPAQQPGATRIPAGAVAAHMVGRLSIDAEGVCELIGYYPFIDGLPDLFAGEPGEKTALLTFRTDKFKLQVLVNGALVHLRGQPLSGNFIPLRVYYDAYPNRDFDKPETFSTGQQVAELRTRGSMATAAQPGISVNVGSLDLASATSFTHLGRSYNLRDFGDGVTINLNGTAAPYGISWLGLSWPFGGTAIAIAPRQ